MKLSELFTAVAATLPARRGHLYEQYFKRKGADEQTRRFGPYYVWTRSEAGRMVSERVAREDVPRVREEIARGQTLARLIGRLWTQAEALARDAGDVKKKSSGRSTRRRPPLSRRP
jgi:hypothetical protein